MSMNNLSIDREFRYIVQWFNEWSELQRDDFVPILVKYVLGTHTNNDDEDTDVVQAATTPVNMNGLPNDLEFNGRPMSLFQCRIKLFNQWNRRWPTEFKAKLQQKITEIDSKVGEKIKLALSPHNIGNLTNGYASKVEDRHSLEQSQINVGYYVSEVDTMVLNDPITEVLNNETSVDDIETTEDINNSIEQPLLHNTHHSEDNDIVADGDDSNDNKVCNNNTRHNHAFNEHEEPVEQVVQMQNLEINEETSEAEKYHEDVTATVEQKQQLQPLPAATVNPVVVTQTITTNAEVPLVV